MGSRGSKKKKRENRLKKNLKPKEKKEKIKWKNRTEEDKQRILQTQKDDMEEKIRVKERGGKLVSGMMKSAQEKYSKIIEANEIPLICFTHGLIGSDKYAIIDTLVIEGRCRICNAKISKAFNMISNEGMIIPMIISILKRQGRLIDKRKKV